MSDQTVTELSIDADTSGADTFTQAMQSAGSSAQQTMLSVAGVGAAFGGVVAAGSAFINYVVDANKNLETLQTTAHQVGLSLSEIQAIQFGGQIEGLSADQINVGLEKSSQLLNDASRNSNSLSKELDANGISVKNANGQLITENQLLGIAADLIKNARNPGDQAAIAQMLGFTKEWVPLLQQGSSAMSDLSDEAKVAGAVIDDQTIQKAAEFSDEWRKSSVEFSTNLKAALAGALPMIDDLIEQAKTFAKSLPERAQQASEATLRAIRDQTGLDQSGDSLVIHVDSNNLSSAFSAFLGSNVFTAATWTDLGKAFAAGVQIMSPEQASATIPGYAASTITEPSYPTEDQMNAAFKSWNAEQWSQMAAGVVAFDNSLKGLGDTFSIVASRGSNANDAVDRAINTLQKHTGQTVADTDAVGLGAGALALFRAQAAETSAIQANHGVILDAQRAKFDALTVSAGAAADGLAKAKVASEVQFASGTALLGASDVQIANQLKTIYGNDIPAALNSTTAAQIRFNDATKEVSNAIQNDLVSSLTDITMGTVSASQGFANLETAVLKSIDQMIIKFLIVQPLAKALQDSLTGGGILSFLGINSFSGAVNANGSIAGAIGPTSIGGAPLLSAKGNIFNDNIMPFANGGAFTNGVVDSPTLFRFANGGSFGMMGEAGPEAVVPLKRGADGSLGIASAAQAPNVFNYAPVIDSRGADATAVAKLATVVANDRQNFERNVTAIVQKTATNKPGAFR